MKLFTEFVKIALILVVLFNAWAGLIESKRKLREAEERAHQYRATIVITNLHIVRTTNGVSNAASIRMTDSTVIVTSGTNTYTFKLDSNLINRIKP
jgi:hypothetical protein